MPLYVINDFAIILLIQINCLVKKIMPIAYSKNASRIFSRIGTNSWQFWLLFILNDICACFRHDLLHICIRWLNWPSVTSCLDIGTCWSGSQSRSVRNSPALSRGLVLVLLKNNCLSLEIKEITDTFNLNENIFQ